MSVECISMLRGMLNKDPEQRTVLIDVMNTEYFMMDDEDIEEAN